MTTYLIVDDHALFRREARAVLEAEGLLVVGEAEDGESAIAAVRALRPDVVLLDVSLPDLDGFAVAEILATEVPRPAVVLISSREGSTYGPRIDASPVLGFVRKDDLSAASIRALV